MSRGNSNQAAVVNQRRVHSLRKLCSQSQKWLIRQTQTVPLLALLGLGTSCWVATTAIAPQVAQAETSRVDISLNRRGDEDYDTLLKRAESAAKAAAQERFAAQQQVDDVAITVVGSHQGEIAPLLSLVVNRSDWQQNPDVKNWGTYYSNARSLLRFDQDLAESNPSQPNSSSNSNAATFSPNRSSNSNTPGVQRNSSGQTTRGVQNLPSRTPRPIQTTPTPTGSIGGSNSGSQSGVTTPTSVGGQPNSNTTGQSGTGSPNSLGSGSGGSTSNSGIDSPEQLTPTSITPGDDLSGSDSSNVVRPGEPTSNSTPGGGSFGTGGTSGSLNPSDNTLSPTTPTNSTNPSGTAGSLNPSDNTLTPAAPINNTTPSGTPNLVPEDNTLNPATPTGNFDAGNSPFSNLAPENNSNNSTAPSNSSGSSNVDSNSTPTVDNSATPQIVPSGVRNTTNNLENRDD